MSKPPIRAWYGVRCVFLHSPHRYYEERVVVFRAGNFEEALHLAEVDAIEYCEMLGDCKFLGLMQAFKSSSEKLTEGSEVFSLIRSSKLRPKKYLSRYFDSGAEIQNGEPRRT